MNDGYFDYEEHQQSSPPRGTLGIYDEGANAYWDVVPVSKNPYRIGTLKAQVWERGWLDMKEAVECN